MAERDDERIETLLFSKQTNSPTFQNSLPLTTLEKRSEIKSNLHGYLTVFGGICIHLFVGQFYLWGNIGPYVVSHYR